MSTATLPTTSTVEFATASDKTLDREFLDAWIQPRHLGDDSMRSYSENFASHQAGLIVLKNFLHDPVASGLSGFINEEAEVQTLYGLYSAMDKSPNRSALVSEAEWSSAAAEDRFYKLRQFAALRSDKQLTSNFVAYLKFLSAFKSRTFKNFFEAITGLEFHSTNETYHFYSFKKGDYLRPHNDQATDYSLAFMLYLSPDWESRFGGVLNVFLPDGDVMKIEPEYNSLVLFNVEAQAMHYVSTIEECAGERGRTAFSGWLHKPT